MKKVIMLFLMAIALTTSALSEKRAVPMRVHQSHAGEMRHDNVSFADPMEAVQGRCIGVIPKDLIPEGKDIDVDSFMTSISKAMRSEEGLRLSPEPSEEKVVTVISDGYGQLEKLLQENDAYTATELIVSGPIDESDFKALWKCAYKGHLRTLDLGKAMIKDNTVPDRALYDYVQLEEGAMLRITKIVLPDDVVRIGNGAFSMMGLREINIPSALREIGSTAFAYDYWLDCPIVIPEGVSEIGYQTFINCIRLSTPVTLPSSLRKIGSFAFGYTLSMHAIELNDGLQYIGEGAFTASGLEEVCIPASIVEIDTMAFCGNDRLKRISLPESMEAIPNSMFYCCYSLEKVSIPDRVRVIEDGAFMGCESLREVRLPESLEVIEKDAFNCCSMETVVLPRNLKSLDSSCFGSNKLHTVFCEAEIPPICGSYPLPPFSVSEIADAVLYVPTGCSAVYRSTWQWNQFGEINETDSFPSAGTYILTPDDRNDDRVYDLSGRRIINPQPNQIYIMNGRKIINTDQNQISPSSK